MQPQSREDRPWPASRPSAPARSSTRAATPPSRSRSLSTTARSARAAVPSGASTGAFEAVELRDGGDALRRQGRAARPSPRCSTTIGPELVGFEASEQRLVDQALIDLDGTPGQEPSSAPTRSSASRSRWPRPRPTPPDLPLFRYVGGPNAHLLPVPMMNILNGGAHADSNVDVQEFMIAPIGAADLRRGAALRRRGLPRAEVGAEERRACRPASATRAASRPNLRLATGPRST